MTQHQSLALAKAVRRYTNATIRRHIAGVQASKAGECSPIRRV